MEIIDIFQTIEVPLRRYHIFGTSSSQIGVLCVYVYVEIILTFGWITNVSKYIDMSQISRNQ